ncbi:MAG: tripartite tricarboxylate transporter substrate binding protein, partial [Burkholderiales bacterium]
MIDEDSIPGGLRRRSALQALASATASLVWPVQVHAQDAYPSKPIRVVVPFVAGGAIDVAVRAMTDKAAAAIGQPMLVDAKPGAATIVGADTVAKAAADGYTILVTTSSTTINNA